MFRPRNRLLNPWLGYDFFLSRCFSYGIVDFFCPNYFCLLILTSFVKKKKKIEQWLPGWLWLRQSYVEKATDFVNSSSTPSMAVKISSFSLNTFRYIFLCLGIFEMYSYYTRSIVSSTV